MTDIYIPPTAVPLEESSKTFFIGIQGPPGSGKSASALTFPNPIILNFDKSDNSGLITSLPHLSQVIPKQIPFWQEEFAKTIMKVPLTEKGKLVDRREAFVKWLKQENMNFKPNQTLILDSWASMQDAFDFITFHSSEKSYDKTGEEKYWAPWDAKITYSLEVMSWLKSCNCNVVIIFHEQFERDKRTGELLNKLQPVMQGKFVTELKRHFPYYVRQVCRETEKGKDPEYLWQTKSDNVIDIKFIGKPDRLSYIPAKYESLVNK